MDVHLSKDLERFIHDAVRAGHYAREDDVIRDALARLKQALPHEATSAETHGKPARSAKGAGKTPLTIDELHEQMLASGLITSLPDTEADFDDPDDQPITIKGEPLSETIIRERR